MKHVVRLVDGVVGLIVVSLLGLVCGQSPAVSIFLATPTSTTATPYTWSVTKTISGSSGGAPPITQPITFQYSSTGSISYTVSFTRVGGVAVYQTAGALTLVNSGLQSADVGSVTVNLYGGGFSSNVLATGVASCVGPTGVTTTGQVTITPGTTGVACSYNISSQFPATQVTATASVVSPVGATANPASTSSFTASIQANGACASISDTFNSNPVLYSTGQPLLLTGSKPPPEATATTLCATQSYSYTVSFGPLTATQCGTYQVTNTAKAVPVGSSQPPVAAQSPSVTLTITGCPAAPPNTTPLLQPPPPPAPIISGSVNPAPPTPAITPAPPRPPATPRPSAPSGPRPTLSLSLVQTSVARVYDWRVTKTASPGLLSVNYARDASVVYTVAITRSSEIRQTVISAIMTITNPDRAAVTVADLKASLTRRGGQTTSVSIFCKNMNAFGGLRIPASVAGGGNVVTCPFNVTDIETSSGATLVVSIIKRGDPTPITSPGVDVNYAGAKDLGVVGNCSSITDKFSEGPANLVLPTAITAGQKVPKDGTRLCASQTYKYTAQFGPFKATQCGNYQAANVATAAPTSGLQQPAPQAISTVTVSVTGCPRSAQPASGRNLTATLSLLTSQAVTSYSWSVTQSVRPETVSVRWSETANSSWSVQVARTQNKMEYSIGGSIIITNPRQRQYSITEVRVEATRSDNTKLSVSPRCPTNDDGDISLSAADPAIGISQTSISCQFELPSPDAVPGTLVASVVVDDVNVTSLTTAPVKYGFGRNRTQNSETGKCATVSSSWLAATATYADNVLVTPVSVSNKGPLTPGGKGYEICDSSATLTYDASWGDFSPDYCNTFQVVNYVVLTPQSQAAVIGPTASLQISVGGCSTPRSAGTSTLQDIAAINYTTYTWTVAKRLTNSSFKGPLTLSYSAERSVGFLTEFKRSAPQSGNLFGVSGVVYVQNFLNQPYNISAVEALIMHSERDVSKVVAACPAANIVQPRGQFQGRAIGNKVITLPPRNAGAIICTFTARDTGPLPGLAFGLVTDTDGSRSISKAYAYNFSKPVADVLGRCADVSDTLGLIVDGQGVAQEAGDLLPPPAAQGNATQLPPRSGTELCDSKVYQYDVRFGPYSNSQCGDYQFQSSARAVSEYGPPINTVYANFTVKVMGC